MYTVQLETVRYNLMDGWMDLSSRVHIKRADTHANVLRDWSTVKLSLLNCSRMERMSFGASVVE